MREERKLTPVPLVVIDNYVAFPEGEQGGVSRYEFADGAVLDHAQFMAEAQSNGLGLRKTRSAGYGDKSRSAWDGEQKAATECEWRIAA